MVAVFRAIGLGLLLLGVVLHIVGFVTHYWVSVKMDMRGTAGITSANGMGSDAPANQVGLSVTTGLWQFCIKRDMGQGMDQGQGQVMYDAGQNSDEEFDQQRDAMGQDYLNQEWHETDHVPDTTFTSDTDSDTGGSSAALSLSMCHKLGSSDVPDWMKAVQALGILALLVGGMALVLTIYGCLGDSKGDRARLLPYTSLTAGILLLIGVIVFGTEFTQMMKDQMSMLGTSSPAFSALAQNIQENTHLGCSFVLEAVSAMLFIVASLTVVIPAKMGLDDSVHFGGTRKMAV